MTCRSQSSWSLDTPTSHSPLLAPSLVPRRAMKPPGGRTVAEPILAGPAHAPAAAPAPTPPHLPCSIPQNNHALVINSNAPTFHPATLASAPQSHVLSHVNSSQADLTPTPTAPLALAPAFALALALVSLPLISPEDRLRPLGVTSPPCAPDAEDEGRTMLLVTYICTARDAAVVQPITTHAKRVRSEPRNHSVRPVRGWQMHWIERRRVIVAGRS
jgi:hypothetical protein